MVSVRDARGQAAQCARRRRDRAHAVNVGQVDIGEADGAAVGEVADRASPARSPPPVTSVAATTGASLVPVMVTLTVRVDAAALAVEHVEAEGLDLGLVLPPGIRPPLPPRCSSRSPRRPGRCPWCRCVTLAVRLPSAPADGVTALTL